MANFCRAVMKSPRGTPSMSSNRNIGIGATSLIASWNEHVLFPILNNVMVLYITVYSETHTHQNGIWSYKLSLWEKLHIIQKLTTNLFWLLSSFFIVEPLWYKILLWPICWVNYKFRFLTHTFEDPSLRSSTNVTSALHWLKCESKMIGRAWGLIRTDGCQMNWWYQHNY